MTMQLAKQPTPTMCLFKLKSVTLDFKMMSLKDWSWVNPDIQSRATQTTARKYRAYWIQGYVLKRTAFILMQFANLD